MRHLRLCGIRWTNRTLHDAGQPTSIEFHGAEHYLQPVPVVARRDDGVGEQETERPGERDGQQLDGDDRRVGRQPAAVGPPVLLPCTRSTHSVQFNSKTRNLYSSNTVLSSRTEFLGLFKFNSSSLLIVIFKCIRLKIVFKDAKIALCNHHARLNLCCLVSVFLTFIQCSASTH